MAATSIDTGPLRRALAMLREALDFWHQQADGTPLKPHLRSAVIQSFEFSYELSVRLLRRVLIERAAAGVLAEPLRWGGWRELRNATSEAYDEGTAQAVAGKSAAFLVDAEALLLQLEDSLGR